MSKYINVFGSTNSDMSMITEGDNFFQFADAGLVPKGGFTAPLYVMWELTSGCTVGDIADQMLKEYVGVDRAVLLEDIKNFIQHMVDERVFFVVSE